VATRDVFSADELAQLRGFPEIGRAELIRFFMLTPADEEFVRRFRDKRNVLGASVQLCTLPWLGFVPEDMPAAPAAAVARLSGSGRDIDDAVLAHIWPTHHENIHFYGTHSVDVAGELAKLGSDGYRPLRSAAAQPG